MYDMSLDHADSIRTSTKILLPKPCRIPFIWLSKCATHAYTLNVLVNGKRWGVELGIKANGTYI